MPNLQVRDIDEYLYESLRNLATQERRSISQEVVYILERYLSLPVAFNKNPTEEFLSLSGSWDDKRNADDIIKEIKDRKKQSSRFRSANELFD